MASVTPNPPDAAFRDLATRIQVEGGKLLPQECAGTAQEFPEAISKDRRMSAEKNAFTSHCGEHRKVVVAYKTEGKAGATVEKRYVGCVNCDGIVLQPRWTQGRWSEDG